MNSNYILACDDRGTKTWPPKGRSSTFTLGGFVVEQNKIDELNNQWNAIKLELCGNENVELKWSHFFEGNHQLSSKNPLISTNPSTWRNEAIWALKQLFQSTEISPLTTVVQKSKLTSDSLIKTKPNGKKEISLFQISGSLLTQFSLYLKEHQGGNGQIWCDQLGSSKEQKQLQVEFTSFFDNLASQNNPIYNYVLKIEPQIRFFDSKNEPMIQIADFVSGVIWSSAENDHEFFKQLIEMYAPGRKRTYGIAVLEA